MEALSSLLSFALYLLPTWIAINHKHSRTFSIFLCNFFLGWTFIAWIIALIWSLQENNSITDDSLSKKEIERINSQKHACKCYMEKLTPGEQKVADTLARELSFKDYFLFNNIIIRSKNNVSSQIDHIVISKFGIFVIESKEYSGWIFGNKNQTSWTQTFPNGEKFKFQNPLHQNYSHIIALQELIPSLKNNFYNVVVFSGDAEIKTDTPENVIHLDNLVTYIQRFTEEKLTEEEMQLVIGKLSYACQTVNVTIAEHVENIYKNKNLHLYSTRINT